MIKEDIMKSFKGIVLKGEQGLCFQTDVMIQKWSDRCFLFFGCVGK
jgi:hypothetical protein